MSDGETPDAAKPKRGAQRIRIQADIQLRKLGHVKSRVSLFDLSPTGCRVELAEKVEVGELVWVTFTGLQSIEARVAWFENWIAGLSFTVPIHPAVFELLVSKMKQ